MNLIKINHCWNAFDLISHPTEFRSEPNHWKKCNYISDGSVVSFQKTAVGVLASVVVFLITAVAVLMRLC